MIETTKWTTEQFKAEVNYQGYDHNRLNVIFFITDSVKDCLTKQGLEGSTPGCWTHTTEGNQDSIYVYPPGIPEGMESEALSHEIQHAKFHAVLQEFQKQFRAGRNFENICVTFAVLDQDRLLAEVEPISDYLGHFIAEYKLGSAGVDKLLVIDETLAVMAQLHNRTGILQGSKLWKQFYNTINKLYEEIK